MKCSTIHWPVQPEVRLNQMQLGQSQTYPEEERPCLSKYWKGKIDFPNREISLALILFEPSTQYQSGLKDSKTLLP